MSTLMLIILLAWFPLSIPLAVLVGKCFALGMGESNARLAPKHVTSRRPQKFFRERASG